MSVVHVFPYRASELPRPRSTRGPPEPLRPPRQQPHPGTLRPAARPPPPLPQENTSVTVRASFLLLTLGMNSGPFSQKERANFQLSSDNQSSSEAPVTLRNRCLHWPPPPPLFDSTPPLCGPKWYSLHRDRLVIQTGCGEEGWTVATPAGLQLRSPPMGKTLPKIFTVKSSHMGMFMCLNSSERAPIEIFHIFCLLPISCLNFLSLLSEFKIF